MPTLSVFGAQWGDEGKGKIIDRLAVDADLVVRYQGGPNAGHTVVVGDVTYVLHLIPSGILHPEKLNVVGNGVAVDPSVMLEEIDGLVERGVAVGPENLVLSSRAHVIFTHHRQLDGLSELWRGEGRIGTTGRGIGPCYSDKTARTGLRVGDLLDADTCRSRLTAALAEKNALITRVHGGEGIDPVVEIESALAIGERLRPYVSDTGAIVRQAAQDGRKILFEGAQGAMLDIDHGTYPYVTSSNTGVAGIGSGVGFPPSRIDLSIGIAKAYCTRVGEGPFPSEAEGEVAERIREIGHEFGSTTGRPRRCGWFDALAIRYALELNGADGLVITNLDVLSHLDEIPVATAYIMGGERVTTYPAGAADLVSLQPEYTVRPGWGTDITGVRHFDDLPEAAQDYVRWIEEEIRCPIKMISIGPERDQVIERGLKPFA